MREAEDIIVVSSLPRGNGSGDNMSTVLVVLSQQSILIRHALLHPVMSHALFRWLVQILIETKVLRYSPDPFPRERACGD